MSSVFGSIRPRTRSVGASRGFYFGNAPSASIADRGEWFAQVFRSESAGDKSNGKNLQTDVSAISGIPEFIGPFLDTVICVSSVCRFVTLARKFSDESFARFFAEYFLRSTSRAFAKQSSDLNRSFRVRIQWLSRLLLLERNTYRNDGD